LVSHLCKDQEVLFASKPVVKTIQNFIDRDCSLSAVSRRKLDFLCEKLTLIDNPPGPQSPYSTTLLTTPLLWKAHSTACYKVILNDDLLTLTSLRTLRRIAAQFSTVEQETGKYLSLRISKLSEMERVCILIFDEIYVYQNIQYDNGKFVCLSTDSNTPATSVLCFMVSSLRCKYADVVSMIPISGLKVDVLEAHFMSVMQMLLNCGYNVIAAVADNHPVNRSYFNKIANGDINKKCSNPVDLSKDLFLLIDPVHTIKNIYNNFQRAGKFAFHDNPYCDSANFNDLKQMYNMETDFCLRKAHKMTSMALNPTNIQRSSAKLAMATFHDSTVAAVGSYSQGNFPQWKGTWKFLLFINKFIRIVNVKNSKVGYRRRDDLKKPMFSSADPRLDKLKEFSLFFASGKIQKSPVFLKKHSWQSKMCVL
jgi:hypothetical protein